MAKTLNGIYNNIYESNYKIEKCDLIFYFSSKFYLEKFIKGVEYFIENETLKLYNKYKVNLNIEQYLAISYYKKLEKRGFYITEKNNIQLSENIVMSFSMLED